MPNRRPYLNLASAIAERYIAKHPFESQLWDWEEAILMFSLTELYRRTQNSVFLEYPKEWMDYHIKKGYHIDRIDFCPPALTSIALYKELHLSKYLDVSKKIVYYMLEEAPRTKDGGILPLDLSLYKFPFIVSDHLFHLGMVLGRWSELTGDDKALDEFRRQILFSANKLLQNSGFFLHSWGWKYDDKEIKKVVFREHDWQGVPSGSKSVQQSDIFWARGNAWVTVALYEYLRLRKLRGETDNEIKNILKRHVNAVTSTQDQETGLWWTVLNRPRETYLETSASSLFAYGLALGDNNGFGDQITRNSLIKAIKGINSRITVDDQNCPFVTGISQPTGIGNFDHYAGIRMKDDISYGVGATILFLTEIGIGKNNI